MNVRSIYFSWNRQEIIIVIGDKSIEERISYNGQEAANLMIALNKADLSITSLQKRILERLVTDGYLSGTVVGSPD